MHQIVKRGPKDYYCTVCHQSWQKESKAYCPGLPVYWHGAWGDLLTKNQLGAKGYSIGKNALPAPVGCYRGMDGYVMLYDAKDATPKRASTRVNTTYYLESVYWPKAMFPILDHHTEHQWDITKEPRSHDEIIWTYREIAELAIHLGCFNEEGNQMTEGVLLVLKPAMIVHRRYGEWGNETERRKLGTRVIEAYRKWRIDTRPRLTDEQLAELEAQRQKREEERKQAEAEARKQLFNFPRHLVENTGPTPTQQSLL